MNNFNPKDKRPNDQQPKMPKFNMNWLYISVLIFIAVIAFSGGGNLLGVQGVNQEATYTKFKEYVSKGYASRIIINNQEHEPKTSKPSSTSRQRNWAKTHTSKSTMVR